MLPARLAALSASLLLAAFGPTLSEAQTAPRARTINGVVDGVTLASGVRAFRGLPFGAPPVRELRWKPPQPAASWSGVRRADRFGPQCMQGRPFSDMRFRSEGTSEDCLYLNVWAPKTAATGSLPVLVYFFGGGFVAGDGSEPRYDGESMAERGIVTVTVNYRLGIFGFFVHPELSKESTPAASGNYGLMDQAAALRWVQANIAAFGGDPKRVTIAGESAGSMSVSALMASPMSRTLFAGAIGESGAAFSRGLTAAGHTYLETQGTLLGEKIGATSLSALRAVSASWLQDRAMRPGLPSFGPTLDGRFLPKTPSEIFLAGEQAHVPLLAGWNSLEMDGRALLPKEQTPVAFTAVLQRLFGNDAEEAARLFPAATQDELMASATALAGDQFIAHGTWRWLELHAKTGGHDVYRYLYARPRPAPTTPDGSPLATGASHSAEIEYAMGNLRLNPEFAWTPQDNAVSTTLQGYFANFIRTGNPNGSGLPAWPKGAVSSSGEVMRQVIDVTTRTEPEPRARYLFLDRFWSK